MLLSAAVVTQAQLIQPPDGDDSSITLGVGNAEGVTLDDGTWGVGHAVDGSGLASIDTNTLHDAMTSGNGGRSLGASDGFTSFIINLGGTNTLGGVVLWNGGEDDRPGGGRTVAQRNQTDRGIQSAEFFYATDGIGNNTTTEWTSLGTFDFPREVFVEEGIDLNSTDNVVGPISPRVRTFTATATDATHIRMDATNWGDNNIVNFSEIAFIPGDGGGGGPAEPPVLESALVGGDLQLSWTNGASYIVQSSFDITNTNNWQNLMGPASSPVSIPATNQVEFLRLIGE